MASKHRAFGQPGATVRVTAEGSAASHFRSRHLGSCAPRLSMRSAPADAATSLLLACRGVKSRKAETAIGKNRVDVGGRAFDQDDPKTASAGRVLPIPDALLRTRRRQDAPGVWFTHRVFAGELRRCIPTPHVQPPKLKTPRHNWDAQWLELAGFFSPPSGLHWKRNERLPDPGGRH